MTPETPTAPEPINPQVPVEDDSVSEALAHLPDKSEFDAITQAEPTPVVRDAFGERLAAERAEAAAIAAQEAAEEAAHQQNIAERREALDSALGHASFGEKIGAGLARAAESTGIKAADVDLEAPISPLLEVGIGKPEDINVRQQTPVEPELDSKFDAHPDQVANDKQVAARQEAESKRWGDDLDQMAS